MNIEFDILEKAGPVIREPYRTQVRRSNFFLVTSSYSARKSKTRDFSSWHYNFSFQGSREENLWCSRAFCWLRDLLFLGFMFVSSPSFFYTLILSSYTSLFPFPPHPRPHSFHPPNRSAWTRSPRWTPPKRAPLWGKSWGGSALKSATRPRCSALWACRLPWPPTWWRGNRRKNTWKSKSSPTMTPRWHSFHHVFGTWLCVLHFGFILAYHSGSSRLTREKFKAKKRVGFKAPCKSCIISLQEEILVREIFNHTRTINALFLLVFIFKTKYPTFQSGAAPDAANLGREHRGLRVLHGRQRRASYSNLRLLGRHSVSQRWTIVMDCVNGG